MPLINGDDGPNSIVDTPGDDTINGLLGDDTITVTNGNDSANGGGDFDTLFVSYEASSANISGGLTNFIYGDGSAQNVIFTDFERFVIMTGSGNDSIGTALFSGNDIVSLGAGNDLAATGAGSDSLDGGAGADALDGGSGADRMTGGDGNDLFFVDNGGDVVSELAGQGTDRVESSVTFTLSSNIENLTLTGLNAINGNGNQFANTLIGNVAANILNGGFGADTMQGGGGNDTYIVDNAGDVVTELASGGTDTVQSSLNHTLGAEFERLVLTGIGNLTGTGNGLANILTGNSGANLLDGAGGGDTMIGGLGNDSYFVDSGFDAVIEAAGGGTDTVNASLSHDLENEVENLTLSGTGNINGNGNDLANSLIGNSGNNILNGELGADVMTAGFGDDTYVVDNVGDVITELTGQGTDSVQSSVSFNLSVTVENLQLTGSADINGTGNVFANIMIGNSAANRLDGSGGADTMNGGLGNDTYVIDNGGDLVIETEFLGGTDTVESSVTFILGPTLENLTLIGGDPINGFGNALDNILIGNGAANLLSGGSGADTMSGGFGDDTYVVDNAGDVAIEAAGEGVDTIRSSLNHTLAAELENLVLTGTGNVNGTGNVFANIMIGNSAANRLDGGAGADTMNGGLGNDTYVIDNVGDVVIEGAGGGLDTIRIAANHTLAAELENLVLTGTGNFNGTGNDGVNVLTGNSGANQLDGGAGGDIMAGGLGDDSYFVDSGFDIVIEAAGGGIDTVNASLSHDLEDEVENLVLTGVGAINGTGNDLANTLTGNIAANRLDGGAGADTMQGGPGNDVYVVDNGLDKVIEAAGEGTDIVQSSANFTMGSNIEELFLTGASAINGTGNARGNVITGNSGDNTLDGAGGADQMNGGLGNDTYVVDNAGDIVIENSATGGTDTVESAISFVLGPTLENLTLTGSDPINGFGNAFANTIIGNDAANFIKGNGGADTMSGGLGDDTYVIDNSGDVVIEGAGGGTDTVQTSVNHTLGAELERLVLIGTGYLNGTGNDLANTLTGNIAANVLDGGLGADTMQGGPGNDVYVVDNGLDRVIEAAGEGTDKVESAVSFSLDDEVENLTLTGSGNIYGRGNLVANILTGNSGANVLNGGAGADTMQGGLGNDTYIIDNAGDVVIEGAGGGLDTVQTPLNHTLAAELENLVLTGTGNVNGTGNVFANSLTGNSGDNILNGGAGADVMNGGLGNDTYFVDNSSDQVIETSLTGGTDIVQSSATFTLGSNIEQLTLTGANAVNGTGNASANVLLGNNAANILDGGAGADIMKGGLGDDIYVVDHAGDSISELAGQGTDKVESAVSFTLTAALESLSLTGGSDIEGTGNLFANTMIGNSGANRLDGGGGADTMNGGAGDDTYIVDNAGDIVGETPGNGTDTVQASLSYTLAPNVENLILTGAVAINGTGNAQNNSMTGNVAANVLKGGFGNDTLNGGDGNDTLFGDGGNDLMTGGAGADRFTFQDSLGAGNADHVADFATGSDKILLENAMFSTLPTGVLAASAFVTGTAAADANDRIIYDSATGNLFYDSDGTGAGAALLFATLDNHPATLAASEFLVI